jgi:hypothetical protein
MTKEKHSETKSHRVGRATLGTGVVTTAYRAVVAFECVQCAGAIAPGALFSRQPRRTPLHTPLRTTSALATDPVCVTCQPLRLADAGVAGDG